MSELTELNELRNALEDARPLLEAAAEFHTLARTPIDARNAQDVACRRSAAFVKMKNAALDGGFMAAREWLGKGE